MTRCFRARLDEAAGEDRRYAIAFRDWLACAVGGRDDAAAAAARGLGDHVLSAGVAGHVLDFDDTYLPGLAHLSAPSAPAALVLAAELGRPVGDALAAYAAGFEAMGALARGSHPALYDGGWHPTAVCGGVGAATAASYLLDLDEDKRRSAVALALLRAGGLRSAFGSAGKALQVGLAAAGGVTAARLAAAGARVALDRAVHDAAGFEAAFGARYAEPAGGPRAIEANWIKAWPCCLQTHGSIEAAEAARGKGIGPDDGVAVAVHPVSLQAATIGAAVADGLQAKFSIPYLTAFTLLHGPPVVESFAAVDEEAREGAERIAVEGDPALLESEAVLSAGGEQLAHVTAALGSPQRPLGERALEAKLRDLAGDRLDGALDDPARPASELLELLC